MEDTDPYENLANAIIIQAAQDYRTESAKLKELLSQEPPEDPPVEPDGKQRKMKKASPHVKWEEDCNSCRKELASIERFFHSKWIGMLSEADGGAILKLLKEEVAEA